MLGKLLKYEFRATGRSMLPALGVLTLLVLLANFSVRMLDRQAGAFLTVLLVLVESPVKALIFIVFAFLLVAGLCAGIIYLNTLAPALVR